MSRRHARPDVHFPTISAPSVVIARSLHRICSPKSSTQSLIWSPTCPVAPRCRAGRGLRARLTLALTSAGYEPDHRHRAAGVPLRPPLGTHARSGRDHPQRFVRIPAARPAARVGIEGAWTAVAVVIGLVIATRTVSALLTIDDNSWLDPAGGPGSPSADDGARPADTDPESSLFGTENPDASQRRAPGGT
jgi:hypothetical protein